MRAAVALAMVGLLGLGDQAGAWDKPSGGGSRGSSGSKSGGSTSSSSKSSSSKSSSSSSTSSSSTSSSSKSSSKSSSTTSSPKSSSKSGSSSKPTSSVSSFDDKPKPAPHRDKVRAQKRDKADRRPTYVRYPRGANDYGNRPYRPYDPYRYGYSYAPGYWAPYYYGYGVTAPASSGSYGSPATESQQPQAGAVRLLVPQEDAAVYVDGHPAGAVGDYDSGSERLYLEPGPHEITLRLDGFRTHTFRIYVPLDQTLTLRHEMVPGEGEDVADLSDWYAEEPESEGTVLGGPAGYSRLAESGAPAALGVENWGRLRLEVLPDDASIYIDGQFYGTSIDLRSIKMPAGMHRIEVVRPGYATVERDVEVKPDQTADFAVELGRN
jgi:hypothetical protein